MWDANLEHTRDLENRQRYSRRIRNWVKDVFFSIRQMYLAVTGEENQKQIETLEKIL